MANFQVSGLEATMVSHLFSMHEDAMEAAGIVKMTVDRKPGFPCRVSLEDAEPGEEVLLVNYQHHVTPSPYRGAGPIFVRKNAVTAKPAINEVPLLLRHRLLSVRAYTEEGMMTNALVEGGCRLESILQDMFAPSIVNYLQIHNAKQGCWLCTVKRAV
jgi:Protein of unknown function (DUF1203)